MATARSCILLVEADICARHPLAEYLRECGHQVLEASDTDQAQEFFRDGAVAIDIVLADVHVPKDGGFALATWLRSNHPSVDVILAGSVAAAAAKAGDLCEEGPMLAKPYDHQLVVDRIRRLRAARDRQEDPPISQRRGAA